MRDKKKLPLKMIFLGVLLLVIVGSVYCINQHNLFKDNSQEQSSKKSDDNKELENKEIDTKQDNENSEEQKVEDKGEESINQNNETKVESTPKQNNNSSSTQNSKHNTNNVTTNNNINKNQNNSSNNTETVPKQEPPKQENQQPVVPSCTPKKFDMNFVRADFSSFGECTAKGDKYKEAGYGYFCDNYQDDCGTTYYMLTIYERNTGKEYDFHTIPLP